MTTVALDLLGGDGAPQVVADAIAQFVRERDASGPDLIVVGPVRTARDLLDERGVDPATVRIVDAGRGAPMGANPLTAIREHDDVSVTVGIGLVAAGLADAFVSVGHTGATVAAAVLGLGRVGGMSRPALAVVLPALSGPVVLLDAGAATDATPAVLRQHGLAGWAYARSLGLQDPAVGLVSIGSEDGKGDRLRRSTHELLAESLPAMGVRYVGPVEGHDVAAGTRAQVFLADGFTGNVLLKAIEGAVQWAAYRMGTAYGDPDPARRVVHDTATGDFAGGMLLGVNGVVVVGHGAGTPAEIRACLHLADRAATTGVVSTTQKALAGVHGSVPEAS